MERLRSNMESSMIRTLARSSESSGIIASLMIWAESIVVKRIQLIWIIFIKRYTVSFAKAGVFRPVIRFIYMFLLEKIRRNRYWKISITGTSFFL